TRRQGDKDHRSILCTERNTKALFCYVCAQWGPRDNDCSLEGREGAKLRLSIVNGLRTTSTSVCLAVFLSYWFLSGFSEKNIAKPKAILTGPKVTLPSVCKRLPVVGYRLLDHHFRISFVIFELVV